MTRAWLGALVILALLPSIARAEARIAYERDGELHEAALNGSGDRRMTLNPATDTSPSWSPGGSSLAFASTRAGGNSDIWLVDRGATRFARLTDDPAAETSPSWSPDGTAIAFERGSELWLVNGSGGGERRLVDALVARQPSWSPDSRRVVVVGERDGQPDLYAIDRGGTRLTRLTDDRAAESWPAWSPDGTEIAFAAGPPGAQQVHVLKPGARRPRQLTTAGGDHPTWSPDGRRIVFASERGGTSAIYTMDRNGGGERALGLRGSVPVAADVTAAPNLATPLRIGTQGRWLVDSQDRVFVAHGANVVHRETFAPPAGFDDDDVAFLLEHGFNVVRLGVYWSRAEEEPGIYNADYLAEVERLVDWLGDRGVHVIINWHQGLYGKRFGGDGFPDWATQDDGLPAEPSFGFPLNYFLMPAVNRAFDHFWANDPADDGRPMQDAYAAAVAHVARRFAGRSEVLGHEIINEPWPGSVWPTCVNPLGCPTFDAGPLTAFHRRVTAAVRAVEPEALVIYEPAPVFNAGADSQHGDLGDARAVFGFHVYCEFADLGRTDEDCAATNEITFDNAEKQSLETSDALLLGEFSSVHDPEEPARIVEMADDRRLGWIWWTYTYEHPCPGCETIVVDPLQPPGGENVNWHSLAPLRRVYPRAIAGTAPQWDYDPATRAFEVSYDALRHAGGITEVALPGQLYPGGYDLSVTGAEFLGERFEVARFRNRPLAPQVRIAITPRG